MRDPIYSYMKFYKDTSFKQDILLFIISFVKVYVL